MSIYRAIARMATVCALNNYCKAPWPTMAGPNIFDSKIAPIEDLAVGRVFPCAVVYTDYDKDFWTKGTMAHKKQRLMTITLELLIVHMVKEGDGEGSPFRLVAPQTDSEIEIALDAFETQVIERLTEGSVASDALNCICHNVGDVISRRGASVEGGKRLAARQITLEMHARREPIDGTIPDQIEAFLSALEDDADYGPRVEEIRSMLTMRSSMPVETASLRLFGYTNELNGILGTPPDNAAVLPPDIVYNIGGSQP